MVINNKITIVTGLWDIKRHELTEGWSRSYEEHYIDKFAKLLEIPYNLIIFGDKEVGHCRQPDQLVGCLAVFRLSMRTDMMG